MKRTRFLSVAAFIMIALALVGCTKKVDPTPPSLSVDASTLDYDNAGNSPKTVSLQSNTSWIISGAAEWVTVSPSNGKGNATISITVQDNPSSNNRSCSLTISTVDDGSELIQGEAVQRTININQSATKLEVDKDNFEFGDEEDSSSINVTSNTSWVVTGQKSWISTRPDSGTGNAKISLSVAANKETKDRECTLEIRNNDGTLSRSIKVKQKAAAIVLSVSATNIRIGGDEGTVGDFNITCNSDWTLSYNANWLSVSSTAGTGNASIHVTSLSDNFSDEEREASMRIISGDKSVEVKVVQEPMLAVNCRVSLADEVLMWDGIAGTLNFGSAVKGYVEKYYTSRVADTYTEKELYVDVANNGTRLSADYNYFVSPISDPNTEYVYCIIAYNSDGLLGPMKMTRYKTLPTTASYDAAITSLTMVNGQWNANIVMQTRCKHYYLFAFGNASSMLSYPDAYIVYRTLQRIIDQDPDNYIILQQYTAKYNPTYDDILVITWGVSDTGMFSNELRMAYDSVSSKSQFVKKPAAPLDDNVKLLIKEHPLQLLVPIED